MAIKLAELGVEEVITLLKSDLGTELGLIDAARSGDSLVLAVPASAQYSNFPIGYIAGNTAHVEVFEGEIEFNNWASDSAHQRATYELPLTVRLTFFNRDSDTDAEMATRARRYAVGIYNVFIKKPTLGGADDAIQIADVASVQIQWVTEGEDSVRIEKALITVPLLLTCEED